MGEEVHLCEDAVPFAADSLGERLIVPSAEAVRLP